MRDFLKQINKAMPIIGRVARGIIYKNKRLKTIYDSWRKKYIIKNYKSSPKYLNVGGAQFVRENWRVLDYIIPNWYNHNPIFVDFNIDLEKCETWPIETESYDLVYTSHTLEHLSEKAVYWTLKEIYRALKKKGGLRITVPDIDLSLYHYKKGDRKWFETQYQDPSLKGKKLEDFLFKVFASHFIGKMSSEQVKKDFNSMDKNSFLNKYIELIQDSWQKEKPGMHRNWFNFEKLNKLLKEIGFSQIIRSYYRQSIFTEFCNEDFDKSFPRISIFVDAIKL